MSPTAGNLKSELAKLLVQNERLLDKKLESALQQRKKRLVMCSGEYSPILLKPAKA